MLFNGASQVHYVQHEMLFLLTIKDTMIIVYCISHCQKASQLRTQSPKVWANVWHYFCKTRGIVKLENDSSDYCAHSFWWLACYIMLGSLLYYSATVFHSTCIFLAKYMYESTDNYRFFYFRFNLFIVIIIIIHLVKKLSEKPYKVAF